MPNAVWVVFAIHNQTSCFHDSRQADNHCGIAHHNDQRRRFEEIVRGDPDLISLLTIARKLRLPQWRIVAGCLYQTVWNVLTNKPARKGIKDYDLIYSYDRDLSWEAEDQVACGKLTSLLWGAIGRSPNYKMCIEVVVGETLIKETRLWRLAAHSGSLGRALASRNFSHLHQSADGSSRIVTPGKYIPAPKRPSGHRLNPKRS